MIVDQTLRNASSSGDTDTIQIELGTGQNRVRASAQSRAVGCNVVAGRVSEDGSGGWVIQVWIEVAHPVVGFIGVRNAVPTQTQVQGQAIVYAPVVLRICSPGNIVPLPLS